MNNDSQEDATNEPIYLNNEATPGASVLNGAATDPTIATAAAAANSTIVPDAHIPPSGGK